MNTTDDVHDFAAEYESRDPDYTPTDHERAMIEDAINSFLARGEAVAWLHGPTGNVVGHADKDKLCARFSKELGRDVSTEFEPLGRLAAPPPSVPTGYKLVPEEPTEEMVERAAEVLARKIVHGYRTAVRHLFKEAFAAAPPAPASQERVKALEEAVEVADNAAINPPDRWTVVFAPHAAAP